MLACWYRLQTKDTQQKNGWDQYKSISLRHVTSGKHPKQQLNRCMMVRRRHAHTRCSRSQQEECRPASHVPVCCCLSYRLKPAPASTSCSTAHIHARCKSHEYLSSSQRSSYSSMSPAIQPCANTARNFQQQRQLNSHRSDR